MPITPEWTATTRAACEGIARYCSATCTSRDPPTAAHSDRNAARSGAGGVSDSTGTPRATASATTPGLTVRDRAVTRKSGRAAARHSATDSNAGTGSRRGDRITAPTHDTSCSRAASRQYAAARNPAPATANDVTRRS